MVGDELRPADAVHALRSRGIDSPEVLLQYGTPDQLLAACRRWDARAGVGPGLLVKWIRDQEFAEQPPPTPPGAKQRRMRDRFDEYAQRFPPGSTAEPHATLIARRWPGEVDWAPICEGDLIVIDATFPILELECGMCGFRTGVPLRDLHVLDAGGDW